MRIKVVPDPPDTIEGVGAVRRSVPLVPGGVADCCDRLVRDAGVSSRDEARRWLTLLAALGQVEERAGGYVRTRSEPDRAALADRFRGSVFGAEELLATLGDANGPLSADAAFAAVADHVPPWERHRDPGAWRETWTRQVAAILDWLVLLDVAERVDGGYRIADAGSGGDP